MINTISDHPTLELGIMSIVICLLGVVVLIGKGDWLIAGYNTASKKEKEEINIGRLRWIVAVVCWITAVFTMLLLFTIGQPFLQGVIICGFVVIVLLSLVLANTWAKRK